MFFSERLNNTKEVIYVIIAVDFDGVLVEDKFPEIGKPNWEILIPLWRLKYSEHEFILWTSRVDDRLAEAIEWCNTHDLKFVAVNAGSDNNLKQYGTDPRKIYADVYIDDRAVGFSKKATVGFLNQLIKKEDNL